MISNGDSKALGAFKIACKIVSLYSDAGPFPAILGKGPWLELGKNIWHFGLFWEFFRSVSW